MKFAYEITAEDKADFLENLSQGVRPNKAAEQCDSTGTQFRKFRNPISQYFDPEFLRAWEEIEHSAAYRREFEDRIRDMVYDSAEDGNFTARWKLAVTHLPEFDWAKHTNLNVNMQMQVLTRALPALTMEELQRVAESLQAGEKPDLKALPEAV